MTGPDGGDDAGDDAAWAGPRADMLLDPTVINLNTGSFGPLSRPVFDRVTVLRRRLAEEPMDFYTRQVPAQLWPARERLAAFLGADPRRVVFTNNVTAALNIVANSLTLAGPGEIVLSDHEYLAMHWMWERAAARQGLTLRTFPLPITAATGDEIVTAYGNALSPRTRLLFMSHVLSATGLVLPVERICAEARRRGILTVVDGAHGVAMLPLDLSAVGCDFYGGNCHKWLLAPSGTGFLYLGRGSEDRLRPLMASWGWHPNRTLGPDDRDEYGSTPRIRALEFEGTRDLCPWLTIPDAIAFQADIGWGRVRARMRSLAGHVRERLGPIDGLRLLTPATPGMSGSMTAFLLPSRVEPAALRRWLWEEYRLEIPVVERPPAGGAAVNYLRVSTHFYNTRREVDVLAEALVRYLGGLRPNAN